MVGDVEGATMQREAKNAPAMVPVRLLGPIGREGRTAGGSQSGRQRLKGCVCACHARGGGGPMNTIYDYGSGVRTGYKNARGRGSASGS